MSDTELKFWAALLTAIASLLVAIISHLSSRSNQRAIEKLRDDYAEARAERDAKRDYEYEARKRLYNECGPLLFQLAELSEAAYHRIIGLAETACQGNLEPGRSHLNYSYYHLSTLHRILAPLAVLKLMQRRLTLVDLSLDRTIQLQYMLARQAFLAFGDDFTFARLGSRQLEYRPFDKNAISKARTKPAVYRRQGLQLGLIEGPIEALLASDQGRDMRVMTYAECEALYNIAGTPVQKAFDGLSFLIKDFHPRTRPVLWRMLVTQACLYRVLAQPYDLERPDWKLSDLRIPESERCKFDWRSNRERTHDAIVSETFAVAEQYFDEKLTPRLERIATQ